MKSAFFDKVDAVENNPNKQLVRVDIGMQVREMGIPVTSITVPGMKFVGERTIKAIAGDVRFECAERSQHIYSQGVGMRPYYVTYVHCDVQDLLLKRFKVKNGLGIVGDHTDRAKGEYQHVWLDAQVKFDDTVLREFTMAMTMMNKGLFHITLGANPRYRGGTADRYMRYMQEKLMMAYPCVRAVYRSYYHGAHGSAMCVLGFSKGVDIRPVYGEYTNKKEKVKIPAECINQALDIESF